MTGFARRSPHGMVVGGGAAVSGCGFSTSLVFWRLPRLCFPVAQALLRELFVSWVVPINPNQLGEDTSRRGATGSG